MTYADSRRMAFDNNLEVSSCDSAPVKEFCGLPHAIISAPYYSAYSLFDGNHTRACRGYRALLNEASSVTEAKESDRER